MALKMPTQLKGNFNIPLFNIRVPKLIGIGGLALIVAGGIWYYTQGKSLSLFGPGPVADINYSIPAEVQPNDTLTIAGTFVDSNGQPTQVAEGFYRVVDDAGNVKATGSLGTNVSQFSTSVSTTGFQNQKQYQVDIADNSSFT